MGLMNTDVAFICKFLFIRWNNICQNWYWCPHTLACICMQMASSEAKSAHSDELYKALTEPLLCGLLSYCVCFLFKNKSYIFLSCQIIEKWDSLRTQKGEGSGLLIYLSSFTYSYRLLIGNIFSISKQN